MPNDLQDWTARAQANLVGGISGLNLGDLGAPGLAADSVTESINAGVGALSGETLVLASFKAAAGLTIARRLALGAFATGSAGAVNPAFGQATVAGNLLVAWVGSSASEPATVTAGWVKVISVNTNGAWAAIWIKLNSAGADAAPAFTSGGTGELMYAQLAEFSGAATAAATDQTASAGAGGLNTLTATNPAADVAFGDLMVTASRWRFAPAGLASFQASLDNSAPVVHAGDSGAQSVAGHSSFNYGIVPAATAAQALGVAPWPYDVQGTHNPGSGGVQAKVVLPAVPGKTYVCAQISASVLDNTGAANNSVLQLLDGATVIWTRRMDTPLVAGTVNAVDLSQLAYKGTPGNSMTLQFAALVANAFQVVNIGAYLR